MGVGEIAKVITAEIDESDNPLSKGVMESGGPKTLCRTLAGLPQCVPSNRERSGYRLAKMASVRWWPDNRPPRSALQVPKGIQGNKCIPNPPSAALQEAINPPKPKDRGFWAPQPGVWKNIQGKMQYVRSRVEPPGWQEPRKKLQFPLSTPAVNARNENGLLPTHVESLLGMPQKETQENYAPPPAIGAGRRPLATINEANGVVNRPKGQKQQQNQLVGGMVSVRDAVAQIEKRAVQAAADDKRGDGKEEACVIS